VTSRDIYAVQHCHTWFLFEDTDSYSKYNWCCYILQSSSLQVISGWCLRSWVYIISTNERLIMC
jgi:hypothetical protein